jgi:archaellum biogenesis protein FlaJ (TadC family)
MMGHGYMPATSMKKGTNLDEQDLEEQIREEAYTDAWEMSLSKAQDMTLNAENKKLIADIVDRIAWILMRENNDIE